MVKKWVDTVIGGIHSRSLPTVWRSALVEEIYCDYAGVIHPQRLEYLPAAFGADMADELGQGAQAAMPCFTTVKADWAHVIGATSQASGVINQAKKLLKNASEERVEELRQDMCYIHDVFDVELKAQQVCVAEVTRLRALLSHSQCVISTPVCLCILRFVCCGRNSIVATSFLWWITWTSTSCIVNFRAVTDRQDRQIYIYIHIYIYTHTYDLKNN